MHGLDSGDDDSSAPERFQTQHWSGDPLDGPKILLDNVVQVFGLAHYDVNAGVFLDAFDGGHVGTALVDGYLFGYVMQVDGALQNASGCGQISLGGEQEVHSVSEFVNGAVEVLPLTGYLDVGFVHPPA